MSFQPSTAKIRPSSTWYVIGSLAIVAGIVAVVASGVLAVRRLQREVDNFTSFKVPAEGIVATVDFARPGRYTLYFQYPSTGGDKRAVPADLAVRITNVDGREVAFERGGNPEITYEWSGRSTRSAGRFTLATAGKYDLQVTGGRDRAPFDVAVGRGTLAGVLGAIVPGLLIGLLLGLVGLVTLVVTAVKRRRAKRIAQAQAAVWAGGGTRAADPFGAPPVADGGAMPAPPAGVPAPAAPPWPAASPAAGTPRVEPPWPAAAPAGTPAAPPEHASAVPAVPAAPPSSAPAPAAAPAPVPAPPPAPVAAPAATPGADDEPAALPPPSWGAPQGAPARSPWDPPTPSH